MQVAPSRAIDLPLRALFWKERDGKVWLTHNDTFYVQQRRNVPAELPPKYCLCERAVSRSCGITLVQLAQLAGAQQHEGDVIVLRSIANTPVEIQHYGVQQHGWRHHYVRVQHR